MYSVLFPVGAMEYGTNPRVFLYACPNRRIANEGVVINLLLASKSVQFIGKDDFSDKGCGCEARGLEKDDERSCKAKLARETSPVHCHQLGFTTKLHSGSQSLLGNRQGAQHRIVRNAFKRAVDFVRDQGQEQVDRCHHRCRRKTFKTGHQAPGPVRAQLGKPFRPVPTTLLPARLQSPQILLIGSTPQNKYRPNA